MYILGIESSCDETAVAVIKREQQDGPNRVIDEQIKSQIPLHSKYGGVVPEIASRNHYEVIDLLTSSVLKNAGLRAQDIDLISLTQGPGLIGSLLIGLSFAKGLAFTHKIPIAAVDHIAAHIEAAFIENQDIQYPLIALVVSGGHTTLFYQESKFNTEVIGKTRDDAVGEVMDKIAKFLGLGYPGGPILDQIYRDKKGDIQRFSFTYPRMSDGSDDFSFSGYKTAVIRQARQNMTGETLQPNQAEFNDLVASFLYSVVGYLLEKTRAVVEQRKVKSLIVSGGVSRNTLLREMFKAEFNKPGRDIKLYMPSPRFCTDNAAMIAWLGYEKFLAYPNINYFDSYLNAYSRALFKEKGKHR
ncbi:MAG: tRNA (adenosine(37)-N6)-threonylcarbamoyltransferase complex transferase subunit TsaD [Acidobacteria bacterium]|jgi:N6-L-threonylcarbamoyladenine synthase|nr:tRNA (adenosine(37)-N6)-threonylcarbamoyltransferase complex transferase subunit TsaD [Acidobacteriota bacterium]